LAAISVQTLCLVTISCQNQYSSTMETIASSMSLRALEG